MNPSDSSDPDWFIRNHQVYTGGMSWSDRVRYDLEVMSRFRFPRPEVDDPEVMEDELEEVWSHRRAFVEAKEEAIGNILTDAFLDDPDDDAGGELPDPLTEELRWVGDQMAWMEAYRDRLIVFARSLASDTVPARTIGKCTRLSHSTIVRMTTDAAVADIAKTVAPVAFDFLHRDGYDPRDDPEFYRRLKAALNSIAGADE